MRNIKPTRCGKCGGKSGPFTMFVDASSGGTHALCGVCMANRNAESVNDLAEIDDLIAENEEIIEKLADLVRDHKEPDLPPELEAFAFTPLKSYQMAQMNLAALKSKRLVLLSHGENEERLQYELNKKVEEENYEEAGEIQKRLEKIKAETPEQKKSKNEKAQKSISQLFGSDEPDDGVCIRCKENFPKPPGLFDKIDIGDCHDMCLSCCVYEVPKYVKTVKMADKMIAEMEKFSGMMDKMAILGKMMSGDLEMEAYEGEDPLDFYKRMKEKEEGQMETEGQYASKMLLAVLKQRREFLERTNEDAEMVDAINMLGDKLFDLFGPGAIADLEGLLDGLTGDPKPPKKSPTPRRATPKKGKKKPRK